MLSLVTGCAGDDSLRDAGRGAGKALADGSLAGTVAVRQGDSLYRISRRHDVPLRDLITLNGIPAPYQIYPGQRLRLPKARVHVVGRGETMLGVSRRYGLRMNQLASANSIEPPYRLRPGQRLRLPDPKVQVVARPPTKSAPRNVVSKRPRSVSLGKPPARSASRFLWPVRGPVSIGFGPRGGGLHNDGINILVRRGTDVRAAENGIVAYSGNEIRGFGNLILIKHSGGWMSAYAHNQVVLVRAGQKIQRGQTISRVGSSGNVSRPQLHFELRRGRRVVDPLHFLGPARQRISLWDQSFGPAGRPGPG